jgi:hypothetical protein
MAKLSNKDTFAFLKSRHIFTPSGAKDLHEYMTAQESKRENNMRARFPHKKRGK